MSLRIRIVTLPGEKFRPRYLVARLAECWREQGHSVAIGPCAKLDADLGILHVDRTWVPPDCLPENPDGRPLLNGSVLDISKRRISNQLVGPDSAYAGPVLVKTDANFFGSRDRGGSSWSDRFRSLRRRLGRRLPWQTVRELPVGRYPILDHPGLVPDWVWLRRDLVVERFLPERVGDEFALRIWLFFGDREYVARLYGPDPIVKTSSMTRYEFLDEVPQSLRARRRELGMDFGKFDYVVVGGEAVLLDVNKTPTVAATRSPTSRVPEMAKGLAAFIGGAGR